MLAAVLLFGSATVLGRRLAAWMRLDLAGPGERLAVPAGLGLAVLGMAGLALGWGGAFHPSAILLLQAAPLLLTLVPGPRLASPPAAERPAGHRLRRVVFAVMAVFAAANLIRALYPPTGFDALNYQLPAVERYLELHALTFPTDLRFAAGPALVPVLFVLAGALGGDLAVQLTSFGMGLVAAAAVHAIAWRAFGPTAAVLAAAVFYTTPIVGWLSAEAYVDLGLAVFIALALHAALVRLRGGGAMWVWVSGLMAGAALGTRYLAAGPVALMVLDLLSAPAARAARGWRQRGRGLLLFAAGLAVMAAPWYARNALESGDPFYPFAGGLFAEATWSEEERAAHTAYLREIGPGRGALDLVLMPFRLTFQPGAFGASGTTGVGYAYLFLTPLLLLVRGGGRAVRLLAAYAGGGLLVWFYTSQQTRFLVPWLLALAVLGGLALDRVLRGRVHLHRGAAAVLGSMGLIALVAGGTRWPAGPPPLGSAARDGYLRTHVPNFTSVERVNRQLPVNAVLYAFGQEGRRYYYRCRSLGDWFGPTAYRRFLPEEDDGEVMARFRRLGVTHVLVPQDFPDPAIRGFRQHPYWWDRLVPLDVGPNLRLYRLVPQPGLEPEGDLASRASPETNGVS